MAQTPATRRVRYQVAASLDGYIAGPNGEADWIPMDPDIDFGALFAQFDTLIMGRRTFEAVGKQGQGGGSFGMTTIVASHTLTPTKKTRVTNDVAKTIAELKAAPGKDIWLFGGGDLFRSMAAQGLVDRVEIALVPVMLGGGLPLFPAPGPRVRLRLDKQRLYEKSGIMLVEYTVAKP